MGYGSYETPLGTGGYNVPDLCNLDGCTEEIDRGLAYLCGNYPGVPEGGGCGRWFCGSHLFTPPEEVGSLMGGGFCPSCQDRYEKDHPGCWDRDEAAWQARHARS